MKSSLATLVLSLAAVVRAAEVVLTSTDPAVAYSPAPGQNSWTPIPAPGGYNGNSGAFLLGPPQAGKIVITPTEPFIGCRFWGWQRSDAGIYQITIDGARASRIDVLNRASGPDATPMELYKIDGLTNAKHVVEIVNLNDTRTTRGFGQMNFDHFVLITDDRGNSDSSASTPPPSSTPAPPPPPASTPSSTPPPVTPPPVTPPPSTTPRSSTTTPVVIQPGQSQTPNDGPAVNPDDAAVSLRGATPLTLILCVAAALFVL